MAEPVRAPFTAYIGGMLEEQSEGYARVSVQTDERHADRNGNVHSGVLTSIMDTVIGLTLSHMRGEEVRKTNPHATIEMSTSFFAWATPGDLVLAEGGVTHITERIAMGEVEARRAADGELLAKARLTFAIPPAR